MREIMKKEGKRRRKSGAERGGIWARKRTALPWRREKAKTWREQGHQKHATDTHTHTQPHTHIQAYTAHISGRRVPKPTAKVLSCARLPLQTARGTKA
jgi:hypothetical protein